jgi:hypothetical protein
VFAFRRRELDEPIANKQIGIGQNSFDLGVFVVDKVVARVSKKTYVDEVVAFTDNTYFFFPGRDQVLSSMIHIPQKDIAIQGFARHIVVKHGIKGTIDENFTLVKRKPNMMARPAIGNDSEADRNHRGHNRKQLKEFAKAHVIYEKRHNG